VASKGYIDQALNGLSSDQQYAIGAAIKYLMDNWRVGTGTRAENAQWYRVSGTTPANANTELALRHGIGSIPTQLFPVLDLATAGNALVPLTVSRAPDATYLYLKSSSTSAAFVVMVEV
jgi:hypothetical protein